MTPWEKFLFVSAVICGLIPVIAVVVYVLMERWKR